MRVNVYAEEMTNRVEIISKEIDGHRFTGLRLYLELPATVDGKQHQGPFMHRPGDDDSSAVTFWGKRDLRHVLIKALAQLDEHYEKSPPKFVAHAGDNCETTSHEPVEPDCWSPNGELFEAFGDRSFADADLEPGDTIHVACSSRPDMAELIDVDDLIDNMNCAATDIAGEAAEHWPYLSREDRRELEQMLVDFFEKKEPVDFYGVSDVTERVLTEDDFQ